MADIHAAAAVRRRKMMILAMRITTGMLLLGLSGISKTAQADPTWQLLNRGFNTVRIQAVTVDPHHPRLLYAGAGSAVYLSRDGGNTWRQCFRAPGQAQIAFLAIDPFDRQHVLAATDRGLYGTVDGSAHWRRLFRGAGTGETQCQVVVFHPLRRNQIFVGTGGGLFLSLDGGHSWQEIGTRLQSRSIQSLTIDATEPQRVYALTDQGLFVARENLETWERLFVVTGDDSLAKTTQSDQSAQSDDEDLESSHRLTTLAIDPRDPRRLYLASLNGLYVSKDRGTTWSRLAHDGLGTAAYHHLLLYAYSPVVIYAATSQGVARYWPEEQRWEILYAGLPTQAAHALAATATHIFTATNQGLYALNLTAEHLAQGHWPPAHEILANFVHEPTIQQVQDAAIAYAEVQPEKISRWRRQAYLSAFLPTVDFGYDEDIDTYVTSRGSTTDLLTDRTIIAKDPSHGFDVSVSWDLGDLIWNSSQTAIDVRSKLMVQLRDDIIDEVTRAYFERRRLQIEFLTDPPNDPKLQLKQELRLQELTAMIDGLSGGWFSHQLDIDAK